MSRTYNAAPSLISRSRAGLKTALDYLLRMGRPRHPDTNERPRQFFGLSSITQQLLDNAERDRRGGLPPDPFDTLVDPTKSAHGQPARNPEPKKIHAARHVGH